ncbi:MAG: hypothetical protein IJ229_11975, partial [Clostridia bacterium]|nr:hypothetical protein [Clostridia bacterium]
AQVMRVHDLGVLKEGYLSDIVVCDGDPLESLECISDAKHIRFVAAGGRVVKNLLKEKTDSAVAR